MARLEVEVQPGNYDLDDTYNQAHLVWSERSATGMDNAPRMKEMFVDLEYYIEEVIGLP